MRFPAAHIVRDTVSSFIANKGSPHEQLSRLDFTLRLAFALSVHEALASPLFSLSMPPTPGLSVLVDSLKMIQKHSTDSRFRRIAQCGIDLASVKLPGSESALRNVDGLRNFLFHGGTFASDEDTKKVAIALSTAIETATSALATALSDSTIITTEENRGPRLAQMKWQNQTRPLAPLLAISSSSNSILLFSRLTSGYLSLTAAKHESGQFLRRTEYEPILRRLFRTAPADTLLSDYVQTVLDDLCGFKELGSAITYISESDSVLIHWSHADGTHTHLREDKVRVGPENAWQWFNGTDWRGYSDFLRALCNWSKLANRLSFMLDEKVNASSAADNALLPLPESVHPPFVPPRVKIGDWGSTQDELSLDEFSSRLSTDVEANRGITYLYFLHAEAGAGKTTTLLHMAQTRGRWCANDPSSSQPLFLYVSARGNVLENLDLAVNAAVAETRLLASDSVRALCRNGLIVPIVDGFDELVGTPTYSDALASLRPWLEALGGRGVMIVSARSNYFVNLYCESVKKENNRDINVRHHIAELGSWSPTQRDNYLKQCGVSGNRLSALRQEERELLLLPFFARACATHLLSDRPTSIGDSHLLNVLIHDYVRRERLKIQSATNQDLLSEEDLEVLFSELSIFMLENNTREVAIGELEYIAAVSLAESLSAELKNRLQALCGLDATGFGEKRFRFSHEVFFDFFLGRYVGRKFNANQSTEIKRILSRYQLKVSAARIIVDLTGESEGMLGVLCKEAANEGIPDTFRANLGELWSHFVAKKTSVGPCTLRHLIFGHLDLSMKEASSLAFEGCAFESVQLPRQVSGFLEFRHCTFKALRGTGFVRGVKIIDCAIESVFTSTEYADDSEKCRRILEKIGVDVIGTEVVEASGENDLLMFANQFLQRINARVTTSIVLGSDSLPEDDPRVRWITRNAPEWLRFLHALEDYGLGFRETIQASGALKQRLRLLDSPDAILDRASKEASIVGFWKAIESGKY